VAFRVLAAPDKFRGTLSASAAASAIARAASDHGWSCDTAPVSDGGEGFLDVFAGYGSPQVARVAGPLGAPVEAPWLLAPDPDDPQRLLGVVESALAIGLQVIGGPGANDPLQASSAGAGQLVAAAIRAGASQVLVGLGGSATTDGGLGAVEVLAPQGQLPRAEILVACDVETKFLDAAAIFGPQKGATPVQVELLARRLERVAQLYQERFGVDVRDLPGSGAAGGLAGGLVAVGAKMVPGFEVVAEKLSLAERIGAAHLVVTGEGRLDRQSFAGKAVGGVARLAAAANVPVLVVAGDIDAGALQKAGEAHSVTVVSLVERYGLERALSGTGQCIYEVVSEHLASRHAP
jgi:glycerate kinase